jgi:predicted extracellular nuclease
VISQVYGGGGNAGASYRYDFIELFNRGTNPVNITGWSVQYASASGATWQATLLIGTIQPGGYYLVQEGGGSTGSNLPPVDASGTIALSATAGKVALVTNAAALSRSCPLPTAIIDLVGYGSTASCFENNRAPAPGNVASLRRLGDGCIDTDNNPADFFVGNVVPRNSSSPTRNCDVPPRAWAIHEIQGTGPISPLIGEFVLTTTNIVTALRNNGFFIQTADDETDDDSSSSQGLFVFSGGLLTNIFRGDAVVVAGTVAETKPASDPASPPRTQINSTTVQFISAGNSLPTPITLTTNDIHPNGGLEQLECYEGMRVRVTALKVASPTDGFVDETNAVAVSSGVFYGTLADLPRPFREPGIDILNSLPTNAPCCVPRFDRNPELLRVDSNGQFSRAPWEVTAGTILSNVVGPLFYENRNYTILPDGPPDGIAIEDAELTRRPHVTASNELSIASMNLEHFYDANDDANIADPVLTATAYSNRLHKAALLIDQVLHGPDIIGLAEVENLGVLQDLSSAVSSQPYEAFLFPGNDFGGINIGFLVNTARVEVLEVTQQGKTATFTNPNTGNQSTLHDRPPLVLRALAPLPLTIIMNHLRSMIDIDDVSAGGFVRAKRRAQAAFIAELVQEYQSAGEQVVVMGDFNAFEFNDGYVDVMGTIVGSPASANQVVLANSDMVNPNLINLIETLPSSERYSYVFDGNAQALDHILVSQVLQRRVNQFLYARNNADFPESFRNDANSPRRISDHDPAMVYLLLGKLAEITSIQWNSTAVTIEAEAAPARSYDLQRSTDLRVWEKIESATADQTGRFSFTDFNPVSGAAFYLLRATDQN